MALSYNWWYLRTNSYVSSHVKLEYQWQSVLICLMMNTGNRDSIVRMVTDCRLDGLEFEHLKGWDFWTSPGWHWGPPSLLYDGYWVAAWGLSGQDMTLTIHSLLVSRLQISRSMPLPLLCACMACCRVTVFIGHKNYSWGLCFFLSSLLFI